MDSEADKSLDYTFHSGSIELYETWDRSPELLLNLSLVESCGLNSAGIESEIISPSELKKHNKRIPTNPPVVDVEFTSEAD